MNPSVTKDARFAFISRAIDAATFHGEDGYLAGITAGHVWDREHAEDVVVTNSAEIIPTLITAIPEVPLSEFKKLWQRALNTLDPQTCPKWAIDIADKADRNESFILNVKAD